MSYAHDLQLASRQTQLRQKDSGGRYVNFHDNGKGNCHTLQNLFTGEVKSLAVFMMSSRGEDLKSHSLQPGAYCLIPGLV